MSLRLQRCFAQTLGVGALFWQAASGTSSAAIWMMIMTLDKYGVEQQADYWRRILAQDPATTFDLAAELAAVGAYRPALHWAAQARTVGHPEAAALCSEIKRRLAGDQPVPSRRSPVVAGGQGRAFGQDGGRSSFGASRRTT